MSHRSTQEPQRTDSARADAEWKVNSGLGNLVHNAANDGSNVNRSGKAAEFPDGDFHDHNASGGGSRAVKGWTGDGKGPINPDESAPKHKQIS